MPKIPANFYTRTDLQHLIARCEELLRDPATAHLSHGLQLLIKGAAFLDGSLADLVPGPHPVYKALENPQGWEADWRLCHSGSFHQVNTPKIVVRLWQQYLKRINHRGQSIPTGRFRITLGDEEHISHDLSKLRDLAENYLNQHQDVTPQLRDYYLERFFPER